MKQFFQHKIIIILFSITCAVAATTWAIEYFGYWSYFLDITASVYKPIQEFFTGTGEALSAIPAFFESKEKLHSQLAELNEEIAELRSQVRDLELLRDENRLLKETLEIKEEHSEFTLYPAKIIGRGTGNFMTAFTINCGSFHGVAVDMPVVTNDGVVGYIREVGLTWSTVTTITETAAGVGVYSVRTGELGTLEGSYSLRESGECLLSFLDSAADIQEGDKIVTSGIGGIYPRGLTVGYVTALQVNLYGRELNAAVKPAVNFATLKSVAVVMKSASEKDLDAAP